MHTSLFLLSVVAIGMAALAVPKLLPSLLRQTGNRKSRRF